MLHAPTSETKAETTQSKTQPVPQPERELYPHLSRLAGLYSSGGMNGTAYGSSSIAQRRPTLAGMQSAHGNQAVLRMMRSPQQVMRMTPLRPSQGIMLQRKCACGGSSEAGGECAECKAKEGGMLQRRTANAHASPGTAQNVPPIVHEVLRSPGQLLDAGTRAFMEPRFGHDFSGVRVHMDVRAAESARAVNALAYTVGRDIVLGTGQYAPGTSGGRRLMAHELTHVVQQGTSQKEDNLSSLNISEDDNNNLEVEARQNSNSADGLTKTYTTSGQTAQSIQRIKPTGLDPTTPRTEPDIEAQRLEAINIVRSNCTAIEDASRTYGIAAEAIAGAILWEALENPYHRSFSRLGPGKVHPHEFFGKSEAEKVEDEKRVTPPSKDSDDRASRLKQPRWAITYIAAIMQRHADNYKKIASVDITKNVGVLCTLYQGGNSEGRAQKLAERRKIDPSAQPTAADEMGPWVEKNIDFVKQLIVCQGDFIQPTGDSIAI